MQARSLAAGFIFSVTLMLSGCGGDRSPHHGHDEAMGAAPAGHPVMHGAQSYFGGKIIVEANLGEGFRHSAGSGEDEGSNGSSRHGHHGHRGGENGEGSGGYLGGGGATNENNMPPVSLRLHLTNTSDAPIDVAFNSCDSSLGNFVVTPEKLTLSPGQSGEPDPMRSLLAVTTDEIPIELSLTAAGKTEKKTLTLRLDQPPATMSEAPAAAPAGSTPTSSSTAAPSP